MFESRRRFGDAPYRPKNFGDEESPRNFNILASIGGTLVSIGGHMVSSSRTVTSLALSNLGIGTAPEKREGEYVEYD